MSAASGPGRFLPTGEWVKSEGHPEGSVDSEHPVTSQSTPEIVSFYRSLSHQREIVLPALGHHYTALIFEGKGGSRIAVVAAGESHNADYFFDASQQEWEQHAMNNKLEVLTHPDPTKIFLGRVVHGGEWKERARLRLISLLGKPL